MGQGRYRDSDRDGRSDSREWNRDGDRDGRADQWDRRDRRSERWDWRDRRVDRRDWRDRRAEHRWRYYGGRHGYDGYRGAWRTGHRFPYYRDDRYAIDDYWSYGLPPPYRGYRYYRTSEGDVVMAAITSGIIGLVLGQALNNNGDYPDRGHYDDRNQYDRGW